MEEKELMPKCQASFRKGRRIIDNIYCVNYLVGRKVERGKKIVTALVDLRVEFDSVDRKIMKKRLEEVGVSKRLRERFITVRTFREFGSARKGSSG